MRAYILSFDIYEKKFKKSKSQKPYDDDEVGKIELCELGMSLACYTMKKEKQWNK